MDEQSRAELRELIADVLASAQLATKADLAGFATKADLADFATKADLREHEDRLVEKMRDIETHLLTEFHRYAKGVTTRLHTIDVTHRELSDRIGLLEERVMELESRIRPKM